MSEELQMWVEVSFNVAYLIVVWGFVIVMFRRRETVAPDNRRVADLFTGAFALLALGDSGHVGFRVAAYALGGLEAHSTLVGLGTLATSITVTLFYVLMIGAWRERFQKTYGWFGALLLSMAVIRFVLMTFPGNDWSALISPQPWATYRNIPLIVQGLGLAYLILRDARAAGDQTFTWIAVMILVSYACYTPVVLFVERVPMLGMLMIPKTMAYVVIAWLAYRGLYRAEAEPSPQAA